MLKKYKKTKSFLKNAVLLITFIATVLAAYFAYSGNKLQKKIYVESKATQEYPIFHYRYSENGKFFSIQAPDKFDITNIEWTLLTKWKGENNWRLVSHINGHPNYLSWYEIRDLYNLSLGTGYDAIKCYMFYMAGEGIPALVNITYDYANIKDLNTADLVLLTRLDTNKPTVRVERRNIGTDKELINNFFQDKLRILKPALENAIEARNNMEKNGGSLKGANGKCGILMNQPEEGF